jgi:hypothetical protein
MRVRKFGFHPAQPVVARIAHRTDALSENVFAARTAGRGTDGYSEAGATLRAELLGGWNQPTNAPAPSAARDYNSNRRSRSAFAITDTELKLIAALAIIGESSSPNTG